MPEHQAAGGYCRKQPAPGDLIGAPCEDCGHAIAIHVGVDHCPVCELVDLNNQLTEIVRGGPHKAITRAMAYEIASAFPPGHFSR